MIFIILISFLILLLFLLLIPVKISIIYNKKSDIYISYLFFKINLANKNSKNKKKSHKRVHNSGNFFTKIKKYINSFMKIVKFRKIIIEIIKEIIKNINFEKAFINIRVSYSEAKNCAMNFYFVRTFIYYFINLFKIKGKIKEMKISIFPSFLEENSKINLDLNLKIVPMLIIYGIIKSLIMIKVKKD